MTLRPIPEDVYSETLQAAYDAGEMPEVFACTDPDATYMQAARGVESLLKDASADYDLSDEAVAQLATRKWCRWFPYSGRLCEYNGDGLCGWRECVEHG